MKRDVDLFTHLKPIIYSLLLTSFFACSNSRKANETASRGRPATYRSSSGTTTSSTISTERKVVVTPATPVVNANPAPGMERDVLDLVNRYRKSKNLPPLVVNAAMEYQARRHSMDMATHRIPFGHQGLSFRMKYITQKVQGVTDVGENVAFGNLSAEAVVSGWLNSAPHRKNIESNYKYTGIGVSRNMQNQLYFTQIFAR
jgi:uncharacterized protein YkwD